MYRKLLSEDIWTPFLKITLWHWRSYSKRLSWTRTILSFPFWFQLSVLIRCLGPNASIVYESCKYSVLDNMETRMRSCDAGMFLDAASSCLLCPLAYGAGSIWVTICAWSDGTLLCTKEQRWHPEALVDALSSNARCVRDQHVWIEMRLSVKVKLLGVRITIGKERKYWDTVGVTHSTILTWNKEQLKTDFQRQGRSTGWGFCSKAFGIAGFPGSPIQIMSWNEKDSTFGPAALAGLELGLYVWPHHLLPRVQFRASAHQGLSSICSMHQCSCLVVKCLSSSSSVLEAGPAPPAVDVHRKK